MKNLKAHIKALLLVGDDPTFAVHSAFSSIQTGECSTRERTLLHAIREDAMAVAKEAAHRDAKEKASDPNNVVAPPTGK